MTYCTAEGLWSHVTEWIIRLIGFPLDNWPGYRLEPREAKLTFQDHSPQKRHSLAHSWDVQPHRGTDRQGQAGGSGAELREARWSCRTWAHFFSSPSPTSRHTTSWLIRSKEKKKKTLFQLFDIWETSRRHNLVLRTPPSLPLLETDTHTHTLTHTHADTLTHGSTPWWFKLQWLQIDPRDSYWKFRMDLWEDAVWRG